MRPAKGTRETILESKATGLSCQIEKYNQVKHNHAPMHAHPLPTHSDETQHPGRERKLCESGVARECRQTSSPADASQSGCDGQGGLEWFSVKIPHLIVRYLKHSLSSYSIPTGKKNMHSLKTLLEKQTATALLEKQRATALLSTPSFSCLNPPPSPRTCPLSWEEDLGAHSRRQERKVTFGTSFETS